MSPSITTKTGDQGNTRLYSGEEVPKSDLRVAACGDIDELNSALGLVRAGPGAGHLADEILGLQRFLFLDGSMVATTPDSSAPGVEWPREAVEDLTRRSREAEKEIQMPNDFILPGGSERAARIDFARSVARRTERSVVRVMEKGCLNSMDPVTWLNRLSDYLWILARKEEGHRTLPRRQA